MSKHTPGPWEVNKRATMNVQTKDGVSIASAGVRSDNTVDQELLHAEQEANARLIASAPELLWSLGVLLAMVSNDPEYASETAPFIHRNALEKARQAIAKAEGK